MVISKNFHEVKNFAKDLRIEVLKMLNTAGSGHSAGSLGMADVFATLYYSGILKFDPHNPDWEERDVVVLSNAHICPVFYASLAMSGYFEKKELHTLRKFGSKLQGHPSRESGLPGIETSGGPLGQGMSVAVGFALGIKQQKQKRHVICFCSDGELNEGQSWEAIMSAAKFKLSNLIFIIDRNNIQIDGKSDDIMPLEPLHEKFKSFGCEFLDVAGNDINKIYGALETAKSNKSHAPFVLIMHTTPGKGVSFMENDYKWHGKAPSNEELTKALHELEG